MQIILEKINKLEGKIQIDKLLSVLLPQKFHAHSKFQQVAIMRSYCEQALSLFPCRLLASAEASVQRPRQNSGTLPFLQHGRTRLKMLFFRS